MASRFASRNVLFDRRTLYLFLALLLIVPFMAVTLGSLSSESFSLDGPGGPLLAFAAGVVSFVSPCVLPIMPIFVTHLSGASVVDGKVVADRRVTFSHAVAFVIGLSIVFIALGAAAGVLGSYFLTDNQRQLGQIAGVMLVAMGVLLMPGKPGTSSVQR